MTRAKHLIKKLCEYCGSEFEAGKATVRYCSHKCNSRALKDAKRKEVIQLTEELTKKKKVEKVKSNISDRPYLNVAETAALLGVCNKTVYNLAHSGKIKATRVTRRMTFISRKSIDELLEANTAYEILPTQERKPIADWYTLTEITEKYGILRHQIRKIVNTENIAEKKDGTRTLIAKKQIDNYFKKKGFDFSLKNLAEWYTIAEIMKEYNMTEQGAYIFVSRYKIPKKQQAGKRYYSKLHIDNFKNKKQ